MSRVLFVTNDFPTRRGGIESFVLALCEQMPPEEVVVYTASMPGDDDYDATLPFPVYRDPASTLLPTPAVGRRVVEVMRKHKCDRVVFGASAPLGLLAPRLRRAGARRIIALTHGHEVWWARMPIARQLLRRIGDSVDVMTYVSEWCRGKISCALSQEASSRMQRLSPGVDTKRFYPGCGGAEVRDRLGIPPDARVVVCTARMIKRKGQDVLIRSWPSVLREVGTAFLLLVGDGSNGGSVKRLADDLSVAQSVVFVGEVPWEDVPAYMDAADIFAMPCRTRQFGLEPEAFGIVFLEAQACGVPVLAGNSGGTPETLQPGVTGFVVDGTQPREVGEALAAMLMGRLGRAGMNIKARAWAEQHSWHDSAKDLRIALAEYAE